MSDKQNSTPPEQQPAPEQKPPEKFNLRDFLKNKARVVVGLYKRLRKPPAQEIKTSEPTVSHLLQPQKQIEPKHIRLRGVAILGFISLLVVGLLPVGSMLFIYFAPASTLASMIQTMALDKVGVELTETQLRHGAMLQAIVCVPFIAAGIGILRRKEWGRRLVVVYSFMIAALLFLGAVSTPAAMRDALVQLIIPGIFIFYFTKKAVIAYFQRRPQ